MINREDRERALGSLGPMIAQNEQCDRVAAPGYCQRHRLFWVTAESINQRRKVCPEPHDY